MNKKILTAAISIISCAVIGFIWAYFLLGIGTRIFVLFLKEYNSIAYIVFLLISTFIAVSGIYCTAERIGMKKGFSKKDFFLWFCLVPLIICFAGYRLCILISSFAKYDDALFYGAVMFGYEKIAYITIMIFCLFRLGFRRLAAFCRKTENQSERNDTSDVYNSES